MASEYDFAKPGKVLYGYTNDTPLGAPQHVRPIAIDELPSRLKGVNLQWDYVNFAKVNQDQIPDDAGVYMFIVHPQAANIKCHSIILYFGRTKSLRDRFRDYVEERDGGRKEDRQSIVQMLSIYKNRVQFGIAVVNYYRTEVIEDLLIFALTPCCNTRRSKPMPPIAAF